MSVRGIFWLCAGAALAAFWIGALASCSKMPGVIAPPDRYAHGPLPARLRYLEVPAADVNAEEAHARGWPANHPET